jgi:hypothetical protein
VTTPRRTDYSREESLRILGPAAIAEIDRIVAAAPPPTPRQVQVLQRVFDVIDQDIARAEFTEPSAAA